MDVSPLEVNPAHIVSVTDVSTRTLESIIAHLEASTDFEHLVYRESELDALWSITGFVLKTDLASPDRAALAHLHQSAYSAHDLVAARRPREAAEVLRACL